MTARRDRNEADAEGGPHRERCSATAKRTGERCRRWPMPGARVCVMHGGAASQVKRAAERRVAEAAAMKAVQTYGTPVETDPITALLDELARTAGAVAWLEAMVRDISPNDAAQSAWVELYRQERRHMVDVAATAIRCGIAERQVALQERQAQLVVGLILRLLDHPELELSAEQRRVGKAFASRELLALEAGPDSHDSLRHEIS